MNGTPGTPGQTPPSPSAVVLTALRLEYSAVRAHLTDLRETTHPQGTVYETGRFSTAGRTWEVAIAEIGAGNPVAALEAERAIQFFNPKVVLFVGVAGGLKDVALGDVVAATSVYAYERGKAAETFEPRPHGTRSGYRMIQRARADARKHIWLRRLKGPIPTPEPRVFVAPIAAGEKVVTSTRSAVGSFLRLNYTDALAVEMEGCGFLEAAHANPRVEALIVRGISDLIDNKSESDVAGYQEIAARHASCFAFEVLARVHPDLFDTPRTVRWAIVLTGTVAEVDKARAEAIVMHLRQLAQDTRLTLRRIEPGSVVLVLEGTLAGFQEIRDLFDEGALAKLLGVHVEGVRWEIPEVVPEHAEVGKGLPGIWNVPHLRNPNFTGREALVKRLRQALTSRESGALTRAVTGLGGVGKTQVAVEYAYRYAADYSLVWWVRAEEPATLAADYATLAEHLGLPQKDLADQTLIVQAVRRWLGGTGDWLLVFDNAEQPENLHDYLPQGSGGHVIVTSVNPIWGSIARTLPVEVWARDESVEFLAKRVGSDVGADALAEELGDLPLALEQAAAYIEATGTTIASYLEFFRSRRQDLWSKEMRPFHDHDTVGTTWSLAMDRVKEASPAAADLLNLCAFLAPAAIPRDLITDCAEHVPQALAAAANDPVAFNDAIAALRRYSLIEVSAGGLSLHRLVQTVVRDRLKDEEKKVWAEAAVGTVNRAFPLRSDDVRTWPICARLLPHALTATQHAEELGVGTEASGRLLNQAGAYLKGRAEVSAAKTIWDRALKLTEAAYGADHPNVASVLNNLGSVLEACGNFVVAREYFERALRIAERAHGVGTRRLATIVSNLGGVLQKLADLPSARAHYQRALAMDEEAYGPEHPEVATDRANLAGALFDLGRTAEAWDNLERAVLIHERAYGPNHPLVAMDLSGLGHILHHRRDLAAARQRFERALTIDEGAYGADHPEIARDLNNLGAVLLDLGDPRTAQSLFERALKISEAAYGPDHPDLAVALNNLGGALLLLGNIADARAYYERALAAAEAAYGPKHPRVAAGLGGLAQVLYREGNLVRARANFERALAIDESAYGSDHTEVARDLGNLAMVLRAQGESAAAKASLTRALAIMRESLGEDNARTVGIRRTLEALTTDTSARRKKRCKRKKKRRAR
jgi:tetratricopeptide (TPR) repeat protein/nucleoside phosphorylase